MNDQSPQSPLPPPLVMMQLLFGKQLTYSCPAWRVSVSPTT